ncbi:serine/threonine-protein kinase [Tautonia rosea]|uniref:serine/threonine-protein kinase n=1 Tax=Tautonia rosea TaxID=2728037 RepID=UPI001472BDBE|nr:serine/threonine-protein kinase [Tautonia rosea]
MNPLARPNSGEPLAETIAHPPANAPRPNSDGSEPLAAEHSPMPDRDRSSSSNGRLSERYFFGSGDRPLDGYTIKRAIGRGGFGEVYYAVSDAGKDVALKLLLRNVEIEKRGVQQCMNLKSPHLITIFDMRTTDEGDTFVVMEYVPGPSLAQILEQHPDGLPIHEARMWLKGLVDGVSYLHDHGIVHRDLKPANLFLEEGVVKIGDYGLSKFIANTAEAGHSASVGTCHYMAPEISTGKYQKPIDIYAIGIIIFEMLTGRVPFDGETPHEVLMKHLTSRPDLSPLPEPYRSIVTRALAKDPTRRPQNAVELLVPQDAPKAPDMRFIGEGKSSPAGPIPVAEPVAAPDPQTPNEQDDVLHIGEEDSVLYIGPNTMPPRSPRGRGWFRPRFGRQARRTPASASASRSLLGGPRHRPARSNPAAVRRPSTPIPTAPPPLPSPRIRVAEAATSMLVSAPLCLLLAIPMVALMYDGRPGASVAGQIGVLAGASLLGAWSLLIPSKFWEGRAIDPATRRFTLGAIGTAVGAVLMTTLDWTNLDLPGEFVAFAGNDPVNLWADATGLGAHRVATIGPLVYFGLIFAVGPWSALVARNRLRRFRIWPVLWTALLGLVVAQFIPAPVAMGVGSVMLTAIVLQLVSPRNKAARDPRFALARGA